MKEINITRKEAGERLDRLLHRYLPAAGSGFLYRMIRKKNITVNGKRAEAVQRLEEGDHVQLWLSDETVSKFAGSCQPSAAVLNQHNESGVGQESSRQVQSVDWPYVPLDIIYEDEDILFVNKPAGMLSQKASPTDVSLCEYLIGYLLKEQKITREQLRLFRPSVCNRLDVGTSGLVACGISMQGLVQLSSLIRERRIGKFYRCLAAGHIYEPQRLDGWMKKDEQSNTVRVLSMPETGAKRIVTVYRPLKTGKTGPIEWTYLEVELITGRSHQIRAHLASISHPLLGDRRYGNRRINSLLESRYGVREQLLHAYRMEFPLEKAIEGSIAAGMNGKAIIAPIPAIFSRVMNDIDRQPEKQF